MCGIVGYVGTRSCSDFLIQGLRRLEYRGYDSSGIACLKNGVFEVVKAEGKLANIESRVAAASFSGTTGIGHTRWATHGKPNTVNAHPHRVGSTVLVHNGIIENFEELREELVKKGRSPVSETDSELFGHLVEEQLKAGLNFEEAVRTSFLRLTGSCSVVVVNDKEPEKIIAVRNGTPLVVGHSEKSDGSFVASDAQALLDHTNQIAYLEDQDLVVCDRKGFKVYSLHSPISSQKPVSRKTHTLDWSPARMEKDGYPHFMLKEIFEQPRAILDTLDGFVDRNSGMASLGRAQEIFSKATRVQIVACGTAWHAGLLGKYILEQVARVPVDVDLASEFRYRDPALDKGTVVLAISQSGETADTLAALREAKARGCTTVAICNVRGSTMARETDYTLFTAAGPEIGVASTKAFTTQVLLLLLVAQAIENRQTNNAKDSPDLHFFAKTPHQMQQALATSEAIHEIAKLSLDSKGFLFIGRGRMFPVALEGALKIKEIAYVHAEGYPAGELKHGPIAMVEPSMTVVVLAPKDSLYEKTISNLQEVKARGGRILAIGNKSDTSLARTADYFLGYDFSGDWSDVLIASIPMQLLAYHMAVLKGTDVDKPRNLAKSVTVE